jgi:hypothetical protein
MRDSRKISLLSNNKKNKKEETEWMTSTSEEERKRRQVHVREYRKTTQSLREIAIAIENEGGNKGIVSSMGRKGIPSSISLMAEDSWMTLFIPRLAWKTHPREGNPKQGKTVQVGSDGVCVCMFGLRHSRKRLSALFLFMVAFLQEE